uniref:Transmembrane protein 132C n=1 Tax=Cyclopterus lumpus TaxID=8103 RepID=A0A8C2WG51_CYCLU
MPIRGGFKKKESAALMSSPPRFSSSVPTYLPVQCQLSGADSAFFLRESNQDVMRNGSLSSRTEPVFLHQLEPAVAAPQSLPSVNCNYGNLSIEQPIPVELLQGPPPHLLLTTDQVTLNWKVKGQVVVPRVGSTRPWIQVLFYLVGRRWDEPDPPPQALLPCVRAVAIRDTSEAAPSAGCRLVGPSGICVVRLEIPPAWFTPPQARKRPPEVTLPSLDVYYSIIPVEGAGQECPSIVNEPWRGQSANVGPLGLGLGGQWSPLVDGEKLRLDENVEVLVPPSPVRLGRTVAFGVYMKTGSNTEQFTLRWELKCLQIISRWRSRFTADSGAGAGGGPSYEVMQLEFEVDNKTTYTNNRCFFQKKDVCVYLSFISSSISRTLFLFLSEVDDSLTCTSTDVDVVKVSPNCDQVLVNGKEMRGRQSLAVDFTYLHLSAQLQLTVWVPKLPLQIDVSDTELSQVKGWRVPIVSNKRPTRDSEDDEDDERKGKGCTLQYQYALVRVLTHFVAEPSDPGGEMVYMLGADWQADITHLVLDQLKVGCRVTTVFLWLQVLSPLSDSILAEKTVTVLDDKVKRHFELYHLVASLSLSMTASPGNYQAIQLTTTATDLLHTPKQEAAISAWIQYSDGSVTPLDVYDSKDFLLSVVSLDESVVSITSQEQHWPIVVAEADGHGPLVRVEMIISETCQKSKRKSVLASGVGNVMVKFGAKSEDRENDIDTAIDYCHSSRGGGPSQAGDYSSYPAQVEVPGTGDSELTQTTRGLSDLEIGMYALLGVFCLAILVFLINCVSFAFRYRHKQVPVLEAGGNMNHAHDWVWLGNEADLLADHSDQCQGVLPDESYEENKYLLNGAGNTLVMGVGPGMGTIRGSGGTGGHRAAVAAAKRKRVQFTSFATVLPNDNSGGGGPYANSSVLVTNGSEDDIKWVCQDMDLGQSEIRTYMERLQDNL